MTIEEKELLKRRIYMKKQLIELTQDEIKKLEEALEEQEGMNNDRTRECRDTASGRSAE
jgi:cell division protein FtsL